MKCLSTLVGVFIAQGPPVPIPNTEVKLCGAEDTCLATDRENRSMPTSFFFELHNDRDDLVSNWAGLGEKTLFSLLKYICLPLTKSYFAHILIIKSKFYKLCYIPR